jgi:hypothetical protein
MRDRFHDGAFPARNLWLESSGVTLPQYAAIKLRVPRSSDPDIDAMIRESRRADFAQVALAGMLNRGLWSKEAFEEMAFQFADAMLAEWEKEAKGENRGA